MSLTSRGRSHTNPPAFSSNQKPTHKSELKSCQIRAAKLPANNKGRLTTSTKDYPKKIRHPCSHLKPKIGIPSVLGMWTCRHCGSTHGQETQSTTFNTDSPKLTAFPNFNSPISAAHHSSLLTESRRTLPASHRKKNCCQNFTNLCSVLFPLAIYRPLPACLHDCIPPSAHYTPAARICVSENVGTKA